jgi:hypothetical protein
MDLVPGPRPSSMLCTGASRIDDGLWAPMDQSYQRYFERP